MQKKIFSLLVLLMTAVSGAWATDSHWPDFNSGYYGGKGGVLVAAIQIDGVTITSEHEGWNQLEVAAFVGNECRSAGDDVNYLYNGYVQEYGDPFPIIDGMPIYYNNAGEQVSFKMYDHINGILYEDCVVTYNGEPLTILTGENHDEGWDDPENPVILSFTTPESEPEAPAVPLTSVAKNEWEFTMPAYAVVAKIEYDTQLALDEEDDNTAKLEEWDGYEADVTLTRTLKKDGWNTLTVPFNVSSDMLGKLTSKYGMSVKQLASTSLENEGKTLMLNFTDATEMVAGTPYLVKVTADYDFSAQALPNVEVSQELHPVTSTYIDFIPTLGKTLVTGPEGDKDNKDAVLFVAANNTLKNPEVVNDEKNQSSFIKGFRAYFQLTNAAASARSFALNLGDETTGITSIGQFDNLQSDDCYDLSGRKLSNGKLSNRQMNKGVYIQNGRKTVVK